MVGISNANTIRHGQKHSLLVSYIRRGKMVCLKSMAHSEHITCPEDRAFLLELSRSQTHDGYVHILLTRMNETGLQDLYAIPHYRMQDNESYKLR